MPAPGAGEVEHRTEELRLDAGDGRVEDRAVIVAGTHRERRRANRVATVGVPQPKAIVELIDFHTGGNLTVPAATVSINGVISRSAPGGTGTYTLGADCTGTLLFGTQANPGPAYDLFVAFKGSQIQMIQTGPGSPVFQGTAERVSR